MNIYLSINNREKVLQLPVLPTEFTLQSPQQNETFQTIALGEINLIGNKGLKGVSFSSIFPAQKLAYSKNSLIKTQANIELENMRDKKIPFRLIITDTPINMPVTIDNFEYGMKSGTKDIQYTIEFKEFRLPGVK